MSALLAHIAAMGLFALVVPSGSLATLPLYGFLLLPLALHRRWPFKLSAAAAGYYAAFALYVALDASGRSDGGLVFALVGGPCLVLVLIGGGVWAWQARRHGIADEQAHARAVLARWAYALRLSKVEPPPIEGGAFTERMARRWAAWRSTSIILPDGSHGTIVINSRSEQLKIALRLVQLVAFVLGICFAGSIAEWIGERMAGHSGAIARGAAREFGRQLGL